MSNQLPSIELLNGLRAGEAIKSFMDELEAVAESCSSTSPFPAVTPEHTAATTEAFRAETAETDKVDSEVKTCGNLNSVAEMYSFAPPKPRFYRTEDKLPATPKPHVNTHVTHMPVTSYSHSHSRNWFAPTELKHILERRYKMLVSAIKNLGHQ
ncbi:MAG TPA: hypothetical protein V6C86_01445 [Oculatellaceae cyanobacterium]